MRAASNRLGIAYFLFALFSGACATVEIEAIGQVSAESPYFSRMQTCPNNMHLDRMPPCRPGSCPNFDQSRPTRMGSHVPSSARRTQKDEQRG